MKTIIKNLKKIMLVVLLTSISSFTYAQTFYVCTGATLALIPTNAPVGTHYIWDVRQANNSISGYPSTTAPVTLPAVGSYDIILNTVLDDLSNTSICPPDAATYRLIVLPNLSIALNVPSQATYCTTSNAPSSDITQTTTGFPAAYTADLEKEYRYTVIKDGNAPVNGATLGTIDATTGKYTLTTANPGTYVVTGYVKYKQISTAIGTLLNPTSGCEANSSNTTQTITITSKAAKPTISFSAN